MLAAAAAVTLLIAGAGWQIFQASSSPRPQDLVQQLFDSLAAHDVTIWKAAAACADDNPICRPGALDRGYQPPDHVTITAGTDDTSPHEGQQTTVGVSYNLGPARATDQVALRYRRTGIFGGVWSITTPPSTRLVIPGPQPGPVTIANADIPANQLADGPLTVTAPPGRYTVTRAATLLVDRTETTTAGSPGTPVPVTLEAAVPPAVSDTVTRLIRDRIDTCAAQHDFQPQTGQGRLRIHSCPFVHETKYTITDDPTWTVQHYPQLHLAAGTDGTITVSTVAPGQAAIHYRYTMHIVEPRDWTAVEAAEPIRVSGRITQGPDGLAWSPD